MTQGREHLLTSPFLMYCKSLVELDVQAWKIVELGTFAQLMISLTIISMLSQLNIPSSLRMFVLSHLELLDTDEITFQ